MNASASWLDQKYANLLSPKLEKFKRSGTGFCFRCPLCGDSSKNKNKTRGNLYVTKHKNLRFGCFNCDYSCSFVDFLKIIDPFLYTEYKTEKFKETNDTPKILVDVLQPIQAKIIQSTIEKISHLPETHPAVQYCITRKIPQEKFHRIGFVENFHQYVTDVAGMEKYRNRHLPKDKRIILELRGKDGTLYGFQGRSIENRSDSLRYITIKTDDNFPKIYGLDHVQFDGDGTLPIFVTEGPIDSLFIPNAIAVCGGDFDVVKRLVESERIDKNRIYVLPDNEPRNKDTIARMKRAIELGFNVMFWEYTSSLKDINDMIKSGLTTRDILMNIKKNSKNGASALAALVRWRKV